LSDEDASTARYPLNRNVSVATLKTQLAVYDAIEANKTADKKRALADIGISLRLQPNNIPTSKDSPSAIADKRMQLSSTVSRYYKQARLIVAATADGVFPAKV
jgi:hypothetical protein